jgi:hypothetical protein
MRIKWAIITLAVLALGCNKDNGNNPNVTLDGALTGCDAKSTCTFNYYENAGYTQYSNAPVKGNSRLFWYKTINSSMCDATAQVAFKTPSNASSFEITSEQIASGGVVNYTYSCACCDYLSATVMGGDIKGKRINSNSWLINASIIMGFNNKPVDTIVVNQYFTQKSL